MRHSWSFPVLLALAALAGYTAGARPVQAQSDTFPFSIGDTVTFNLQPGRHVEVSKLKRYVAHSRDAAIRPGQRQSDTEIVSRISSG